VQPDADVTEALNIVVAIAAWTATVLTLIAWIAGRLKAIEHSLEHIRTRIHRLEIKAFGFPREAEPPPK